MDINPYILESSPLFNGIAANHYHAVLSCIGATIKTFKKGEFISLTSDNIRAVGIVLNGSILLLREDIYGNRNILNTLTAGEVFGESFVCGGAYTLTISVQALTNTNILFLSFDHVMKTCSNACEFHSTLMTNMVTMIAQKNLKLLEKLEITTKHSLREKILTYLSHLAQQQNSFTVVSPLKRGELADFLGVHRSALTRELNQMQENGLLCYNKNTYTILSAKNNV